MSGVKIVALNTRLRYRYLKKINSTSAQNLFCCTTDCLSRRQTATGPLTLKPYFTRTTRAACGRRWLSLFLNTAISSPPSSIPATHLQDTNTHSRRDERLTWSPTGSTAGATRDDEQAGRGGGGAGRLGGARQPSLVELPLPHLGVTQQGSVTRLLHVGGSPFYRGGQRTIWRSLASASLHPHGVQLQNVKCVAFFRTMNPVNKPVSHLVSLTLTV